MISDLNKCIFDGNIPTPGKLPNYKLRFKVGDFIECNHDGWKIGIVSQLWHRDELWESGKYDPYLVILLSGREISISQDDDLFIREVDKNTLFDNFYIKDKDKDN